MNRRQSNILTMLLSDYELQLEKLTEIFEVSDRTLRNDVRELNQFLPKGTRVNISEGGKIVVISKEKFSDVVARVIDQSDYYHYKLSAQERRAIESLILLYSSGYVTTVYLADKLLASKNTIVGEIEYLKDVFIERGLLLQSKSGRGFRVVGEEKNIRKFIFDLNSDSEMENKYSNVYRALFERELNGQIDRKKINEILYDWENRHQFELTDQSFHVLENYLVIIANRIKNGNILLDERTNELPEVTLASDLLERLLIAIDKKSEPIIEAEAYQLSKIIIDCHYIKKIFDEEVESSYLETRILAFIYNVCRRLSISQNISYDKFNFIFAHINSAIWRIRQGNEIIKNTHQKGLEEIYPDIFAIVREEAVTLDELIPGTISGEELSYITMYFIAIMEENASSDKTIRAVLVCSAGMCTAMLLQAKLKMHFNIEIVDVLSLHKYKKFNLENVDLVLSTVYIRNTIKPTACISPILSDNDIKVLHETIQEIKSERSEQEKNILQTRITAYIDEYRMLIRNLHEANEGIRQDIVEDFYHKHFDGDVKGTKNEKELYRLLEEDCIVLNETAADWEEAIEKAGKILLKKGYIEKQYIERMIEIVRINGPYNVFIPHVAVAHASADDGSKELGISLLRLKEPVNFHHSVYDPVQIVICISGGKEKGYLEPFFHLIRIFQNEEVLKFILSATNATEIINIIRFYEKYFFKLKEKNL